MLACMRACSHIPILANLVCHLLPASSLTSMSSLANIIALVLLVVCAFLWLRAMYHQFEFAGKKPE